MLDTNFDVSFKLQKINDFDYVSKAAWYNMERSAKV